MVAVFEVQVAADRTTVDFVVRVVASESSALGVRSTLVGVLGSPLLAALGLGGTGASLANTSVSVELGPSRPAVVVTLVNSSSLSVEWTAPVLTPGTAPVIAYRVYYRLATTPPSAWTTMETASNATWLAVTGGLVYDVRVVPLLAPAAPGDASALGVASTEASIANPACESTCAVCESSAVCLACTNNAAQPMEGTCAVTNTPDCMLGLCPSWVLYAAIGGAVLCVALLVGGCVRCYRRDPERMRKTMQARLLSSSASWLETNPIYKQQLTQSRPLSLAELRDSLARDPAVLDVELASVPKNTTPPAEYPETIEALNRYQDVLPTPHTRVLLTSQHGDPNSTYINANFIRGFQAKPCVYIATQAPTPATVDVSAACGVTRGWSGGGGGGGT